MPKNERYTVGLDIGTTHICCVVGDGWAVRTAVAERSGGERWTRLAERLRGPG